MTAVRWAVQDSNRAAVRFPACKFHSIGGVLSLAGVIYSAQFNKSKFVEESNLLVLNKLERLLTVCFKPKENYTRSELLKVNEK